MTSLKSAIICLTLFFLIRPSSVYSYDIPEIHIHGFLSQGYFWSTENQYLGDSEEGSFEFNEIGINFTSELFEDLRFGIQIFSRDMGEYGNNDLEVDWAFLDYHKKDWAGVRVGKIKMPYGLFNKERDADMLRIPVFLPQTVYPEGIREMLVAFQGIELYGSCSLNQMGDIDYEAFIGTLDIDDDSPFLTNMFLYVAIQAVAQGVDVGNYLPRGLNALQTDSTRIEGGKITWNTSISGFQAGWSFLHGKSDVTVDGINFESNFSIDSIMVFSLLYEKGDWLFVAEYATMDASVDVPGLKSYPVELEGYYAGVGYKASDIIELACYYGEYYPIPEDKDGDLFKAAGLKDYYAWQKDLTFAVKFNINEYLASKFEVHFIDGVGLCSLDNNPDADRNWMLFTGKISLSF